MNDVIRIHARNFPALRELEGPMEQPMNEHYATYRGFVTRANDLFERLGKADRGSTHSVDRDLRTLLTELPSTLAAVKSYERFLAHLGGTTRRPKGAMSEQIRKDFGDTETFLRELTAASLASRGWVAVTYDLDLKRLVIAIGDTPEKLPVWNAAPVIVLEVSERPTGTGTGRSRERDIAALLEHLDWSVVDRNLEDALGLQPAGKPF